jgi:hypothetical protein
VVRLSLFGDGKADPMALAFMAGLIYFTPGLAGVARFASVEGPGRYHMPFEPVALLVMAMVLGAITVAAALVDRVPPDVAAFKLSFESYVPSACLALAYVAPPFR